jgi:hypothetical protein
MLSPIGVILLVFVLGFIIIQKNKDVIDSISVGMTSVHAHDGNHYTVLSGVTETRAADMLANVNIKTKQLLNSLSLPSEGMNPRLHQGFIRLKERVCHKHIRFMEIKPDPGTAVAINTNKGDSIQLCLFGPDNQPVNSQALFSVVVHELAHIMEVSVSKMVKGFSVHSEQFKLNEKFIMKAASDLGFVPRGGSVGAPYCGITIPNPETAN